MKLNKIIKSTAEKVHKINLLEHFADDVFYRKSFGLRNNSGGYQTGDYIKFTVIDASGCKKSHPINNKLYLITYVWVLTDSYVVGIREDENDSKKM